MDLRKRRANEKKYMKWVDYQNGYRIYYLDVLGHNGSKARYVKEVDENDITLKFYQEIYNEMGILVEIHEKYPINKGHLGV